MIWVAKGAISLDFLSQPLRVASSGVSLGAGDLLSVLKMYVPQEGLTGKLVAIACLLLAGSAPFWVRPNPGDLAYWSFCSVASLSFVTHLGYDYVFLLLPAVFAIKNIGSRIGVLMASLVSFPWFITKILIGVGVESGALMHFGLAVNLLMLWLLWIRMHKDTRVSMV